MKKKIRKLLTSGVPALRVGRMPLIMLILSVVSVSSLTSCQNGYYYDANGYLRKVPESLMYRGWTQQIPTMQNGYGIRQSVQQPVPRVMYYELPPAKVPSSTLGSKRTPSKVKNRSQSKSSTAKNGLSSGGASKRASTSITPPTGPSHSYGVKEDKVRRIFNVVNSNGKRWQMSPIEFYPFWAKQIYEGGYIHTYK